MVFKSESCVLDRIMLFDKVIKLNGVFRLN